MTNHDLPATGVRPALRGFKSCCMARAVKLLVRPKKIQGWVVKLPKLLFVVTAMTVACAANAAPFTFGPYKQFAVQSDGVRQIPLAVADVTGDGRTDVLLVTRSSSTGNDRVFMLAQTSSGTLAPPRLVFDCACILASLRTGDMDGDGTSDILVGGNNDVTILSALGNGEFTSRQYVA